MFYKCEIIKGDIKTDVTPCLKNWDDIECDYKRSQMGGVVRTFTSKFEFIGEAYDLLYKAYMDSQLRASIDVRISTQTETWEWAELFTANLDASTMETDGTTISISATDSSLVSRLSAKKSTKFEYLVSEMATETFTFERIPMNNYEEFVLTPKRNEVAEQEYIENEGAQPLPIYYTNDSIPVPGAVILQDQEQTSPAETPEELFKNSNTGYFLEARTNVDVRVRFELKMKLNYTEAGEDTAIPNVYLYKWNRSGHITAIAKSEGFQWVDGESLKMTTDTSVRMSNNERLSLVLYDPTQKQTSYSKGNNTEWVLESYKYDTSGFTLRVDWKDTGADAQMDCVKPLELLNKLLGSISPGATGVIDPDPDKRLTNCRLIAAESARKINDAKMYSTFQNFCNFMETLFGYVYEVENGNTVHFKHRNDAFKADSCKMIQAFDDFQLTSESSMLYTSIEIGHDKVDYDEENGRNEFNFKHTYTTGYTFGDNTLRLDPSYRTDSYGIEYLVEKRSETDSDDHGDTDIIAIHTNGSTTDLRADYSLIISGPPQKMPTLPVTTTPGRSATLAPVEITGYYYAEKTGAINAWYHPYYCALANAQYLATFADKLTYASSEAGEEVYFSGKSMERDIDIATWKKYAPLALAFKTNDGIIPADLNGKVGITANGKTYEGWVDSLKVMNIREKETDYRLLLSCEAFHGLTENDDRPEIVPAGSTTQRETIYILGSWYANPDGTYTSVFKATSASATEYTIRAAINHYDDGGETPVLIYEYYKVAPGTTEISGLPHTNPHYSEVRAIKKAGANDKNTYIANYQNIGDSETAPDTIDVNLNIELLYDTRLKTTEVTAWINKNAVEDITMNVTLRSSTSADTKTALVTIPAGETYSTTKVAVAGDFNRMDTPVYNALTKTNIKFSGYTYSMITSAQTPEETSYQKPVITSIQVDDIKADGSNSVSRALVFWSQTDSKGNTTTGNEYVTFQVVTASAATTTSRTKIATRTATITKNGVTSDTFSIDIYQEGRTEQTITWNAPSITSHSVGEINAEGSNTISTAYVNYSQSNSTGAFEMGTASVSFQAVSASANTGARRLVATRNVTITKNGQTSASYAIPVYQAAGTQQTRRITIEVENNYKIPIGIDTLEVLGTEIKIDGPERVGQYEKITPILNQPITGEKNIDIFVVLDLARSIDVSSDQATINYVEGGRGEYQISCELSDTAENVITLNIY